MVKRILQKFKYRVIMAVVMCVLIGVNVVYQPVEDEDQNIDALDQGLREIQMIASNPDEHIDRILHLLHVNNSKYRRTMTNVFKKLNADNPERTSKFFNNLIHHIRVRSNSVLWKQLNIMGLPQFNLDTGFKNPCWRSKSNLSQSCELSKRSGQVYPKMSNIRCLPYFLVIGQAKCGTTDIPNYVGHFKGNRCHNGVVTTLCIQLIKGLSLAIDDGCTDQDYDAIAYRNYVYDQYQFRYFTPLFYDRLSCTCLWSKLISHPDVVVGVKETQWLCRERIDKDSRCGSIDSYLEMFQTSADIIDRHHTSGVINPYITGEATPGYFSNNDFWDLLPGNENCTEPCVTNAENLHHLLPGAKLILILRDPVDRLYSHYFHKMGILKRPASREDFHHLVEQEIDKFKNCEKNHSQRACCYDYMLSDSLTEQIDVRRSIYHVYLEDWLKVFPRKQVYVLRFEDYISNTTLKLSQIYDYLGLKKLSTREIEYMTEGRINNQRSATHRRIGKMWNSTRQLLEDFYKPYKRKLAHILLDEKCLWS